MKIKIILLSLFLIVSPCFAGVDFDTTDDELDASDSSSLDISGNVWSFTVWIKPSFIQTDSENQFVFCKTRSNNTAYRVIFNTSIDDFRIRQFTSAGINCDTIGLSWTANTWHHLSGRYDGSNVRIYWDGVLENTCGDSGNISTNNDALKIGSGEAGASTDRFGGVIGDLAIWDTDIGADAVVAVYNAKRKHLPLEISPSSLVGYWPLDECTEGSSCDGVGFKDLSVNGNTATGDNGANNTGLTGVAEQILSYP